METFCALKKYLRLFGILSWDSTRCGLIIGVIINCFCLVIFFMYFLSSFCFFLFRAENFNELSESFFQLLDSLLMISWYSIYLIKRGEYVKLFTELDQLIGKRK